MSDKTLPTYISHGCVIEYEPPLSICNLTRYNIAKCARERMSLAHSVGTADQSFELWKRERYSFWTTLRASIPFPFL